MKVRTIGCIGSLVACLVVTGCASLPKTAVIPTGRWSGDGMFVAGKWAAAGSAGGQVVVTRHGEYSADLLIEDADVDGGWHGFTRPYRG